jgi:hypothetical protein
VIVRNYLERGCHTSLDLPDFHVVPNFFLGVLQGGVDLLLTVPEACERTQVSIPQKYFPQQDHPCDDSTYRWTKRLTAQ